jgi:hypothetical protein
VLSSFVSFIARQRPGGPLNDRTRSSLRLKRINATTVERTDKKGGKVVQTITRVMSADGKALTITTKGTNAQGQAVNNVAVYEKQ